MPAVLGPCYYEEIITFFHYQWPMLTARDTEDGLMANNDGLVGQ